MQRTFHVLVVHTEKPLVSMITARPVEPTTVDKTTGCYGLIPSQHEVVFIFVFRNIIVQAKKIMSRLTDFESPFFTLYPSSLAFKNNANSWFFLYKRTEKNVVFLNYSFFELVIDAFHTL